MSNHMSHIDDKISGYIDDFKKKLKDKSGSLKDLNDVIKNIGELRTWQIIEPLEDLLKLKETPEQIKIKILDELGRYGEPRVIRILVDYIHDEDKSIKNAAVKGLSRIRNQKCVDPLLESIEDEEKWIRIFSIIGLQKNETKKAVKPIIKCLGDPDEEVRKEAMASLENMSLDLTADELIESLHDPDRYVKFGVAAILGDKEVMKASDELIKLLESEDKRLSIIASRSLSKIGDPNAIPKLLLKALDGSGVNSIYALSIYNMGEDIITPLLRLYIIADNDAIRDLIKNILRKFGEIIPSKIMEFSANEEKEENKRLIEELFNEI